MIMTRAKQEPISNPALGLLALFALATVAALGLLFHAARTRAVVASGHTGISSTSENRKVAVQSAPVIDADNSILRIAARSSPHESGAAVVFTEIVPPVQSAAASKVADVARETPLEAAAPAVRVADASGNLTPSPAEMNNDLVPEINGVSYTTKKLLSNGMDPNNPAKPDANKPGAKKPGAPVKPGTPPKPVAPVTPPAKPMPPKTEPAKSAVPALPSLPFGDSGKVDFSHSPIYVLNDGRRLRALLTRENNGVISIRNEAGVEISFKKSDVKEIVRN